MLNVTPRSEVPRVFVYYGPTGVGKSFAISHRAPSGYRLPPQQNSSGCGWWEAYDNQRVIIIEEFYGQLRWNFLLQLLDRYPLRVEHKGGSCEFVGTEFHISSNRAPWEWYDSERVGSLAPLARRITKIYLCEANGVFVTPWVL